MKILFSTISLVFLSTSFVFAQAEQPKSTEKQSALVTTTVIKVESIQCGSCVRTVEKALAAVAGVESAKVNLKMKTAIVTFLPGETTLAQLETAITMSGYSANDKKADPVAYEKLDDCCKVAEE